MSSSVDEWNVRELADRAGTTVRTIHYYIAEGLLPPARGTKRSAVYRSAHLDRLRLIAALRDEGLALAAVRVRLAPLTDAQVRTVVATLDEHLTRGDAGWTTLGLLEAALARETTTLDVAAPAPATGAGAESLRRASSRSASFARLSVQGEQTPVDRRERHAEHELRESAGEYLDRLLRRRELPRAPAALDYPPPPAHFPPQTPLPPSRRPEPPGSVRPEAWYHFQIDDGIELRVREDRYRESKGQLRSIVDSLRPILRRYGLAPPDDRKPD